MGTFYRHPIGLLSYDPQEPQRTQEVVLYWCVYDVGSAAFGHLNAAELTMEAQAKHAEAFKSVSPERA
jgi:hypothetical protein